MLNVLSLALALGVWSKFLSSPTLQPINSLGSLVILGSSLALLGRWLHAREELGGVYLLYVLVPTWLAIRSVVEAESSVYLVMITNVLALVGAVLVSRTSANFWRHMAWAGLAFVLTSFLFGALDATGLRFAGVSVNPNRMVAGMALAIPFFVARASRSSRTGIKLVWIAATLLAALMIVRSGSSQGFAALVVLGFALAWMLMEGRKWLQDLLVALAVVSVCVLLIELVSGSIVLDDDYATLSGRTPLFRAAWEEILTSPWYGTGYSHFNADQAFERSAHAMPLSLALIGGIPIAVLWTLLVVRALGRLRDWSQVRFIEGCAVVSLAVLALTQNLELLPITWVVLVLIPKQDWQSLETQTAIAHNAPGLGGRDGKFLSTRGRS